LANLLASAPDVHAYSIKHGTDQVLGIARARAVRAAVISLSYVFPLNGLTTLPDDLLPLRLAILDAIASGVTVVAAAGNGQIAFPGMMPEVISVGGVAVNESGVLTKWPQSSSFISSIYAGRHVPDLCGIASGMWLPNPPGMDEAWDHADGGTSSATPAVAGVCALLLQKDPTLSPHQIRKLLMKTAKHVGAGTGAGLVDALAAWNGHKIGKRAFKAFK
jgi:subtilisin family serine protease